MKTFAEDGNTFIIAKAEEGESFKGDYYPRRIPNTGMNSMNMKHDSISSGASQKKYCILELLKNVLLQR